MSDKPNDPGSRRAEAEAKIVKDPLLLVNPQPGEVLLHKLLHELQVHQIELKTQNEELQHAQIAMERSRDRYAELYDFAPIGYLTVSREGMITEINLTASDMLGVVRRKLLARRFSQFVAEEDRDRWYRYFSSVLKHEQRQHCDLTFMREDGSRFHAKLDSLRVSDAPSPVVLEKPSNSPSENDATLSVRIALTDITEQMQARTALQEAREFAESIVDTVRDPLIVLDNTLKVVSANRSFYEYFHVTQEETAGQHFHELGNGQWDIPKLRTSLETILANDNVLEGYEVEHVFPVIGKRKMLLNARRIIGKSGKTQSILLEIADVTARG